MNQLRMLLPLCLAAWLGLGPAPAQAASRKHHSSSAKSSHWTTYARNPYLGAIVVDAASGRILFQDNADAKGIPASLVKLMDMLIILEKVEHGQLSLNERVPVSAKAASMPQSNVALRQNESFTVEELLYALMVRSANDAAVALAEKVGGSTEGFIELMNQKAHELGMTNTVFRSVNGLPPGRGEEHCFTTARDISRLCLELLKHKEALRYTSTRERVFRPNAGKQTVHMVTHNHLLRRVKGCDGLKTGYIAASGFSIAVTAERNGQRLVAVVLDSIDSRTRDNHAAELVEKGFAKLGQPASPAKVRAKPRGRRARTSKAEPAR